MCYTMLLELNVLYQAKTCLQTCAKCRFRSSCPMPKISSGPLISIYTFCSIQWFCKQTVKALIRLHGCAGWSGPSLSTLCPKTCFRMVKPQWNMLLINYRINQELYTIITIRICLSKQCRPRSDAKDCDIWSGSTLFDSHPAMFRCINR